MCGFRALPPGDRGGRFDEKSVNRRFRNRRRSADDVPTMEASDEDTDD